MASYCLSATTAKDPTMTIPLEVLEAQALQLSPTDRERLLERLVASLDADPDLDHAWELEADRREALLDAGAVDEIPGPQAIEGFRARISG